MSKYLEMQSTQDAHEPQEPGPAHLHAGFERAGMRLDSRTSRKSLGWPASWVPASPGEHCVSAGSEGVALRCGEGQGVGA